MDGEGAVRRIMERYGMEKNLSQRQRQILHCIIQHTEAHGFPPTVREIGEAVNLSSSSTVHGHLKALEQGGWIRREAVLTRAIRVVTPNRLEEAENVTSSPDKSAEPVGNVTCLPLVGCVAAGSPTLAFEDIEDTFPVSKDLLAGAEGFFLRVKGESMIEDGIRNGDYVIVRRQVVAENGDTVVAMVDEEATVKRFYKERGKIRLQPANQAMEPMYFDSVEIIGKVVGLFRKMM
jgi:repressor LexA